MVTQYCKEQHQIMPFIKYISNVATPGAACRLEWFRLKGHLTTPGRSSIKCYRVEFDTLDANKVIETHILTAEWIPEDSVFPARRVHDGKLSRRRVGGVRRQNQHRLHVKQGMLEYKNVPTFQFQSP